MGESGIMTDLVNENARDRGGRVRGKKWKEGGGRTLHTIRAKSTH